MFDITYTDIAPTNDGGYLVNIEVKCQKRGARTKQLILDASGNIIHMHECDEFNGSWACIEGWLFFVPYGEDDLKIWGELISGPDVESGHWERDEEGEMQWHPADPAV